MHAPSGETPSRTLTDSQVRQRANSIASQLITTWIEKGGMAEAPDETEADTDSITKRLYEIASTFGERAKRGALMPDA